MTEDKFIENFINILQTEEKINFGTVLEDLEDWDSLTSMAVVSFFLENNINITVKDIVKCKTVGDIARKFGIN